MLLSHKLIAYDGKPCPYCNRRMGFERDLLKPTRDHYPIPKSRGGRRTIVCCYTCNHMKSDMSAGEWMSVIAENKGGWFAHRSGATLPEPSPDIALSAPAKPIPYAESRMILTHGKKAWKFYKETGIKPAPLVCPVITMAAQFFMELKYPNAYRMPNNLSKSLNRCP